MKKGFTGIVEKIEQPKINIKEKFVNCLNSLVVFTDERNSILSDDAFILYENDADLPILKEKMNNLINKLNSMSFNEKISFIELDIEEVIWNLI